MGNSLNQNGISNLARGFYARTNHENPSCAFFSTSRGITDVIDNDRRSERENEISDILRNIRSHDIRRVYVDSQDIDSLRERWDELNLDIPLSPDPVSNYCYLPDVQPLLENDTEIFRFYNYFLCANGTDCCPTQTHDFLQGLRVANELSRNGRTAIFNTFREGTGRELLGDGNVNGLVATPLGWFWSTSFHPGDPFISTREASQTGYSEVRRELHDYNERRSNEILNYLQYREDVIEYLLTRLGNTQNDR